MYLMLVMLQENGIEDFDTLDATVETQKPPSKAIEATSEEDRRTDDRDLTDEETNYDAANLPEYNVETRADFEGNQEAADWLTQNPNSFNIKQSYEDTLSLDDKDSMDMESKGRSSSFVKEMANSESEKAVSYTPHKGSRHRHYKSQAATQMPQREEDNDSNNDDTFYNFGDLNLKETEEENTNGKYFNENTNGDAYNEAKYTDYDNYERPEDRFKDTDNVDESNNTKDDENEDEDYRADNEGKEAASQTNNDEQQDEDREAQENTRDNSGKDASEGNPESKESKHQNKEDERTHSERESLGSGATDTDPHEENNNKVEGSDNTQDNKDGLRKVSSDASSGDQIDINVDSKTKSFRLGNMTIHIKLSDSLREHKASPVETTVSGKDTKSTELSKQKENQKDRNLGVPTGSSKNFTTGHSKKEPSNLNEKMRKVFSKAPDTSLDTALQNNHGGDKGNYAEKPSVHSPKSNADGSGSQAGSSKDDLEELSKQLKSIKELMQLMKEDNDKQTLPSPQKHKEQVNSNQQKSAASTEQEVTASRRKQESKTEDTHGKSNLLRPYGSNEVGL